MTKKTTTTVYEYDDKGNVVKKVVTETTDVATLPTWPQPQVWWEAPSWQPRIYCGSQLADAGASFTWNGPVQ